MLFFVLSIRIVVLSLHINLWYNLSRYHKIMTLLKLWFTKFDVSILLFDIIYLSMNKIKQMNLESFIIII